MNIYDELCAIIDKEIVWCEKHRNPFTIKFENGFINGLSQAKRLIGKAKEIAEDEAHELEPELEPSCYCVDCGAPEFHTEKCRSYTYYKDEE